MDKGNEKRLGIKIICGILAFVLWLYITNVDNPTRSTTLKSVQVELTNEDTLAKSNMSISPGQKITVDLDLEGTANEIYSINKEEFVIKADLSAYALKIGDNNIPVQIEDYPTGINIKNNAALSVKITIEELIEKEINVYSNVKTSFKSGVIKSSAVVKPNSIEVSGPASAVNKVTSASLVGEALDIDENYEENFNIIPIDDSGNEVTGVNLSQTEGTLLLKVGSQKDVSIGSSYSGSLKAGLKVESLDLSSNKITIIGDPDVIGEIDKIETQPIDLSQITSTQDINLNFIIPEGTSIASNRKYVTANIKIKEEETITKIIDGIVVNLADKKEKFTYEVPTVSVTIRGTAEALSGLTLTDFKASASIAELAVVGESEVKLDVSLVESNANIKISSKPEKVKVKISEKVA
ncbi:CdaR family protein [Clostridium vincentii]|uniref:YbbR-like protein n=1 Tax=Clostridium vincentii TaxID=52704 RepID=A0A2T0BIB9_9CLOT|nr:CdaR family protein [Clostridium vincentii]PRR83593.1 YbbR-like protein [Clostridium vincentii]